MAKKKKGKYSPKLTAEEYKELTGQGFGSLVNQSTSVINNTNAGRNITGTHG